MRVLILLPALTVGGTERQTLLLAANLPRIHTANGHPLATPPTVTLATLAEPVGPQLPMPPEIAEPPTLVPRGKGPGIIGVARGLARFIDAGEFDVVQSMLLNRQLALAMSLLPRRRRPGAVFSLRGANIDPRRRAWFLNHLLDPALTRHYADAVISNSAAAAKWARSLGYPIGKLHVIPNAIDFDRLAGTRGRDDIRAEFGVASGAGGPLILAVGRLSPEKRFENLVDAVAACAEFAGVRAVIVGDGPARERLAAHIESRGLSGRVILAGNRTDIGDCLRAADIFIHPSESEGWPNVVGEALACGALTVGTTVGETAAILGAAANVLPALGGFHRAERGLLIRPNDPTAIAAAIRAIVADRDSFAPLAAAGAAFIAREFSPLALAQRTADLYAALLAKRRR